MSPWCLPYPIPIWNTPHPAHPSFFFFFKLLETWRMLGRQQRHHLSAFSTIFQHWTDEWVSCLKVRNSTAEGGDEVGGLCSVWVSRGGQSALRCADRAQSYIQELIHVTGSCCHSAACRHLTWCMFHMIKCAYSYTVCRSEGRHHTRLWMMSDVRC